MNVTNIIDRTLEATVVPSFTRIGWDVRSRLYDWVDLDQVDLTGRLVAITGATSGLGLAGAKALAGMGASLIVIGRNPERLADAVREIDAERDGAGDTLKVVADLADFGQVRAAASQILRDADRLDVLIHNAGALSAERSENDAGVETTVAAQVDGPFLLTTLLLDRLAATPPGRVVTMSSGGMYTAPLTVSRLEMGDDYDGTTQYARAKRAQVTLNELWAERIEAQSVVFHAMHPGWADTPGVATSLPGFARVMGPLLRSSEQGADTMVWLAAADEPLRSSGGFWLDRQVRPIHRLPATRRSDTPERRSALWERCVAVTGAEPPPSPDRSAGQG
jgi:dehydrogenase/reductase SDR family protein 12